MQSNDTHSESKLRKSWIGFDDRTAETDDTIDGALNSTAITIETDASSVATIEPSHSIQITNPSENSNINIPDNDHRRSVSPSVVNKLPPPPPVQRSPSNDNTNNNNVNNRQSIDTPIESNNLQCIPLKDICSTTTSDGQRNHSASPQHYSNGDVIVTLLPLNSHCSWLTPAKFKPELVPEELMSQCLSLTVEDYVSAMQVLVNDLRFNLYISLYKRILVLWIALGFIVLLTLLFSGVKGMALFGGGVLWLIINAVGIFITMWFKIKLYHTLERCIAHVNSMLYKYNILLGVDDRGKISCHKINLVFVYFDVSACIKYLNDMLEAEDQLRNSGQSCSSRPNMPSIVPSRMDIDTRDIIITGINPKSLSQKQKYAEKLLLRYSQRWVKEFIRRRMDLNYPVHGDVSVTPAPSITPRHCVSSRCPCQFIEEHLKFKPLARFSISELFM